MEALLPAVPYNGPRPGSPEQVKAIIAELRRLYPDARCSLNFSNPLELLVATQLAAQCTDIRVNIVTEKLFHKYRTVQDYATVSQAELEEDIRSTPLPHVDPREGSIQLPTYYNYGVGEKEKEALFNVLPALSLEATVRYQRRKIGDIDQHTLAQCQSTASIEELQKLNMFTRLVDLRNANARGIAYENRRRIIAAFSEPENPNDTGRPEVQGAFLITVASSKGLC